MPQQDLRHFESEVNGSQALSQLLAVTKSEIKSMAFKAKMLAQLNF